MQLFAAYEKLVDSTMSINYLIAQSVAVRYRYATLGLPAPTTTTHNAVTS